MVTRVNPRISLANDIYNKGPQSPVEPSRDKGIAKGGGPPEDLSRSSWIIRTLRETPRSLTYVTQAK
jgi:hypothetical protein